ATGRRARDGRPRTENSPRYTSRLFEGPRSGSAPASMHVFFEDDGQLKAGTVLADNDTSLQVEAASGKRLKIKAAAVLLRFAEPSPSALNADAHRLPRRPAT